MQNNSNAPVGICLLMGLKKKTRFSRDAFLRSTNEGGAPVSGSARKGARAVVHLAPRFTPNGPSLGAANKGIQEVCDKRRTQGICTTIHRGWGAMRVMR